MEVMREFQQDDMVVDYGKVDNTDLYARIDMLLVDRLKRSAEIRNNYRAAKISSARQFEFLFNMLGRSSGSN